MKTFFVVLALALLPLMLTRQTIRGGAIEGSYARVWHPFVQNTDTALVVSPSSASGTVSGAAVPFTAVGNVTGNSYTSTATWTPSNPSDATMSANAASCVAAATVSITAAYTGLTSGTATLTCSTAATGELLSGATVSTSGTLGSTSNPSPAISVSTPSGWTLESAENFSGGILHASDKTTLGSESTIQCTTSHSSGGCALQVTVVGDGCSYCTWTLNGNVVPSSATAIYLSFWQYEPGAVEGLWGAPNFYLANVQGGGQAEIDDRWSGVTCNGSGPGSDYYCTQTRSVFSPGSNATGGANAAYYGSTYSIGSGSWVQYELYFQPNTSGSNNGLFDVYRNGVLIGSTANGSAGGTGNAPTGDLNGTLSMAGMSIAVGGYYLLQKVTDSTGTVCEDPQNPPAGAVWTNTSFASMAPCPTHASFNRYFDDIIVMYQ